MSSYILPFYTQAVKEAATNSQLPLTQKTGYEAIERQTQASYQRHRALDYLRYDLETIKALRAVSVQKNNERRDSQTLFDVNQ